MMSIPQFPVCWPDHIARSKSTEPGRFKTSLVQALQNVEDSLRMFGRDSGKAVSDLVISSNYSLTDRRPRDSAVAVWFLWDGEQRCIPVDRYSTVEANLQAIHHVVEARRTELRHGTLALVRATLRGFVALPSPEGTRKRLWREVMGYGSGQKVTIDMVRATFRKLASQRHPDKPSGSEALMSELNAAFDEARKELGE